MTMMKSPSKKWRSSQLMHDLKGGKAANICPGHFAALLT
jgi:hypothetical protein